MELNAVNNNPVAGCLANFKKQFTEGVQTIDFSQTFTHFLKLFLTTSPSVLDH